MGTTSGRRVVVGVAVQTVLMLLLTACGGGSADVSTDPTAQPSADPTTATEAPTTEADSVKSEAVVEVPDPTPTPVATTEPPEPVATPTPTEDRGLTGRPTGDIQDAGDQMGVSGETIYDSYSVITDDTGAIEVEVPTVWADVDGLPYNDADGRQLFDVRAAEDLEAFSGTWDVPGVIVTASREVAQSQDEVTLLDELVDPLSGACTYLGRQPYDDGLYTGQTDVYDGCGGTQTGYIVVGAVPASRAFVVRVQVQVVDERDLEALQHALDSFIITGDV